MTVLLNRQAKLIVRKTSIPETGASGGVTELTLAGERISFSIEKNDESSANTAKISIYNLNQNSRAFFSEKALTVQLFAGYKGLENDEILDVIFNGEVTKVATERNGVDIVTTIEAADSLTDVASIFFNATYKAGNTHRKIIIDIIKRLNVTYSETAINRLSFSSSKTNSSTVYSDKSSNILTRLLANEGYKYSIQDGVFEITSIKDTNIMQASAVDILIIAKETGLLGFPVKTNDGVIFTSLINTKIRPGSIVNVKSLVLEMDEKFIVKTVKYNGDTHRENWEITAECLTWTQ